MGSETRNMSPMRDARRKEMKDMLGQLQGPLPMGASKVLMVFLKALPSVSLGFTAVKLVGWLLGINRHLIYHPRKILLTLFNINMFAEALWVLVCALLKARGQRKFAREANRSDHEVLAGRQRLFAGCLASMERPHEFCTRWFGDGVEMDDLCRGNFEDFVSWSIFYKEASALSTAERIEMEGYVRQFEIAVGRPLKTGHNGSIKCYKFTFQPVESIHRPLCYYAVTHGLVQRVAGPAAMRLMGFSGRETALESCDVYFRHGQPSGSSEKLAPIVFAHGIGIGIPLYLKFIRTLLQKVGPERDVIVLELPAISQQLFPKTLLPELFVNDCRRVLAPYQATGQMDKGAVFLGHSYGCFCLSWVAKRAPEVVQSLGFLDPGSFCLHDSTTLRAVVYKQPHSDTEVLFHYYMRSELFFNNHLKRQFRWQDNHLNLSDIPDKCRTLIVLSEHDEIMPVDAVRSLHERHGNPKWHSVVWLDECIHGGMLLTSYGEQVCDEIARSLL